jgi:hypothetical protein
MAAARSCLDVGDNRLLTVAPRCGNAKAFGVGAVALVLPVFATSYAVRWGGSTARSRGRIVPTMVLGSASAVGGYLMAIEGHSTVAGALLALGLPAVGLFSDRFFRVLR